MKKKRRENTLSIKRLILTIVIILALVYAVISFPKKCNDEQCFNEKIKNCKVAYFTKEKNGNYYLYSTTNELSNYLPLHSKNSNCFMKVTLQKTSPATVEDVRELLEGKSMTCAFPMKILPNLNFEKVENILDFCHGELKESIYELILNRMHNLIIGNLDEILTKMALQPKS